MNSNGLLYDLTISLSAVGLWFTPFDITRATGYTLSLVFSSRAYYSGLMLISEERKTDEKQAVDYEASLDFYDQLLGANVEASLEVKALEVETRMIERMIPLMKRKTELEWQLNQVRPVHPELSEEEREDAAKNAIEEAFNPETKITEEDIRKAFPEQMDATSWKAILKALQNGSSKAEIIKDVLGCSQANEAIGKAYFELLKRRFMDA